MVFMPVQSFSREPTGQPVNRPVRKLPLLNRLPCNIYQVRCPFVYLCFPVRAYYQLKAYQTIPRKKNISMLYSAYGFFTADITNRHETDINQKDGSRIGNRFSFYADMGCNKRRSTGLCRSLYRTVVRLGIYRVGNSRNAYHTASEKTAAKG